MAWDPEGSFLEIQPTTLPDPGVGPESLKSVNVSDV